MSSAISQLTQDDHSPTVYFYEKKIDSNDEEHAMIYWLPDQRILRVWTYDTDFVYEGTMTSADFKPLTMSSNETDAETKFLKLFKKEAIGVKSINDEFAEVKYLSKTHKLNVVNDPEFVSDRLCELMLMFQEEQEVLKGIINQARGPKKERKRITVKQGTDKQSLINRNKRARPDFGLGPRL